MKFNAIYYFNYFINNFLYNYFFLYAFCLSLINLLTFLTLGLAVFGVLSFYIFKNLVVLFVYENVVKVYNRNVF